MAHEVRDIHSLEAILRDERAMPRSISFSLLQRITDNFSEKNKIGSGGFGTVYKGMVGGQLIAVKRLDSYHVIEDEKFQSEVRCLTTATHENIVRFLGYCAYTRKETAVYKGKNVLAEVRERLFCMEYLPSSLKKYRTGDGSYTFTWHECFKIINGICQGLQHLREKNIIHLDLKPDNILLDADMVPKITDFGLSRLFGEDKTRTITSRCVGTLGYMAPEYQHSGVITFKADIYSLGVVIEEMVAGKSELDFEKVAESWRRRMESDMPQGRSSFEAMYNQVKQCIKISKSCTAYDPNDRPDIKDIIRRLDKMKRWRDVLVAMIQLKLVAAILLPFIVVL